MFWTEKSNVSVLQFHVTGVEFFGRVRIPEMSFDRSGPSCEAVASMPLAVGGDTATPRNLRLRFELMKQYIASPDFVLDVGCGRAEYLRLVISHAPNALGIETAADKLADCFALHPELNAKVLAVSAESMPFPTGHFDVVIVNEVLEHIPDQDAALREIYRVLKPGGKFLLFCPNRLFPFETHGFRIRGAHANVGPRHPLLTRLGNPSPGDYPCRA
jgi:SAM-dependent methyltransferase